VNYETPRNHERVPISLEVEWEGRAGKYEARMSDLSLGGCYIDTIGEASVGDLVHFKVRLPAGHWLRLSGVVVHVEERVGIGLRFPEFSEGYTKLLKQLIESQQP
jgi:Tfp pilus assembly protein PilZ